MRFLLTFLIVLVIVASWLRSVDLAQHGVHHVTQSVNGRVFNELWTTNPVFVRYSTESFFCPSNGVNGVGYRQVAHTNFYWSIWPIFR